MSETSEMSYWTKWHNRLHKNLIANPNLLPCHSSLLLAVSGGQDSIVLTKLIFDLKKFYEWKIHIWHGDHGWHDKSGDIAKELSEWCKTKKITFFTTKAEKNLVQSESSARNWRYESLLELAKNLSLKHPGEPCHHILTGHTGSDRAETLIMNLARGAHIKGLSSLRESRNFENAKKIKLVRPLLGFSRKETYQICEEMNLPIWVDPSNSNTNFRRNKIRKEILPVLESMHPGSSIRISLLAERLSKLNDDQETLAKLAFKQIKSPEGLSRKELSKLSESARATILSIWLRKKGVPNLTAKIINQLSHKIGPRKPPGSQNLSNKSIIKWSKDSIKLIHL